MNRPFRTLLGAVAAVWLVTAIYTYFDARHEINELLDAHLAQSASLIVAPTAPLSSIQKASSVSAIESLIIGTVIVREDTPLAKFSTPETA